MDRLLLRAHDCSDAERSALNANPGQTLRFQAIGLHVIIRIKCS
jgi:hypothetical protein